MFWVKQGGGEPVLLVHRGASCRKSDWFLLGICEKLKLGNDVNPHCRP